MSRVPVSMLTCTDMEGYELLRTYGPLALDEVDQYFELLRGVLDRWFASVGVMGPAIYIDYRENEHIISETQRLFDEMLEEDEPFAAMKVRDKLDMLLDALSCVMREMAEVFNGPATIREFYYNLPARLRATYEHVLTGDDE